MRERFEAVETPLKRTSQSQNARSLLFLKGSVIASHYTIYLIHRVNSGLRYYRCESGFGAGFEAAAGFFAGLETPKLIRKKRRPLRSESRKLILILDQA